MYADAVAGLPLNYILEDRLTSENLVMSAVSKNDWFQTIALLVFPISADMLYMCVYSCVPWRCSYQQTDGATTCCLLPSSAIRGENLLPCLSVNRHKHGLHVNVYLFMICSATAPFPPKTFDSSSREETPLAGQRTFTCKRLPEVEASLCTTSIHPSPVSSRICE